MASYSDEEILDEIRRVAELSAVDGTPSMRTFDEHAELSAAVAHRSFGSWNAAVEQAGLDPNTDTDKIPRDELAAELRRLRDELDQIPTADQMDDHGAYAYITYYERFGSWADALEEVFGEVPDREWKHISDDELIAELQRLAGDDDDPPTTTDLQSHGAYSRTAYEYRFGSWRDALEAAGFEPPPPQRVPTAELLAELRRLHDELTGRPTTTIVREHGSYSPQTYYDRFDSWDDALDAAFETVPEDAVDERGDDGGGTKAHSDEALLDELRRVADVADSDGAPSISEFDEHSDIADSTIHRRFGSWNAGVERAGFEPRQGETRIPDDDLVAELQRLRDEVGQPPTQVQMDEQGAYSPATYTSRFESWTAALAETFDDVTESALSSLRSRADDESNVSKRPHVSDEDLLADLQALAEELGRSPSSKDMRKHGSHSVSTYLRRFDSWSDVLEAADLDPPDQNKITDAELIADLHRLRDELGERPASTDVAREGEYGLATYQRRFGSWSEAAAAAFDETDA